MKHASLFVAVASVVLIAGCSTNTGRSTSVIPPVQAQSTYSIASLTGTYSMLVAAPENQPNTIGYTEALGTFTADGAGNITAGSITERSAITCSYTFTGTYTLQSNASGTAVLNVKGAAGNSASCRPNGTLNFVMIAGLQGTQVLFNETDANALLAGVAIKQ